MILTCVAIFLVMAGLILFIPQPVHLEEDTNFDKLYLDDLNDMMTPRQREALVDYIHDYAWHYGRLYHIGDAEKIQEAISEKFILPEEIFKTK